jgi:alcohol dehydrogenase
MKEFSFLPPKKTVFGFGVSGLVGNEAIALGRRVLVVSDPGVVKAGLVEPIRKDIGAKEGETVLFSQITANPRDVDCAKGVEVARDFDADVLVAVGGGSVIDTAKCIATILTNGGQPKDWYGFDKLKKYPAPLIAIPTTAGTGSEVTTCAVVTDSATRVKECIQDAKLAPSVALVDPGMTLSVPPLLTAATGMDALCHAVEAYTCTLANPLTDVFALKAISIIARWLEAAYANGSDLEARIQMSLGCLLGGYAFSNSDTSGIHCMAESMGGLYDTPHGIACSIFLPFVTEFNIPADPQKHADVASAMGVDILGLGPEEGAMKGVEAMHKLYANLKIPMLKDLEYVKEADFPELARRAAQNVSADSNPREAGEEEYLELYRKAYKS